MSKKKTQIPLYGENPEGLHQRYIIRKVFGKTDPSAEYFVLRLDLKGSDPNHILACRKAIQAYAKAIKSTIPKLADDLRKRYPVKEAERLIDAYLVSGIRQLGEIVGRMPKH